MRSLQRGAANAEFCQRYISFCTVHVNNDILRKDRQTLLPVFILFKPEFFWEALISQLLKLCL